MPFEVRCVIVIHPSAGSPFACLMTELLTAPWKSGQALVSICRSPVGAAVSTGFMN